MSSFATPDPQSLQPWAPFPIIPFPLDIKAMDASLRGALDRLAKTLMNDFSEHSLILKMSYSKWGAMDMVRREDIKVAMRK